MIKNDFLDDSIVFVSGGTGSFGQTLVNYLLRTKVKEVRVFSRDEKKQEELRFRYRDSRLRTILGDVRDAGAVKLAMKDIDYVFHAAALKQVPSCEFNPFEAVKTNILGANNVIDAAVEHEVRSVVVLSTDKAVYPINSMGTSKAMMEKLAMAKARECFLNNHTTKINVTRYGNVMGSRGSVIPLFLSQIRENRDITVTDPNMTRFMMSLDESVDLVLYAFSKAEQGDLIVRKSPGATVAEIAESLKRLCNSKVNLEIIGARHGEKLHETLCGFEEMAVSIDEGDFYRVPADLRDLTSYGGQALDKLQLDVNGSSYTSENTHRLESESLDQLLKQFVFPNGADKR